MSRHSLSPIMHKAWLEHTQAKESAVSLVPEELHWAVVPLTASTLEPREQG